MLLLQFSGYYQRITWSFLHFDYIENSGYQFAVVVTDPMISALQRNSAQTAYAELLTLFGKLTLEKYLPSSSIHRTGRKATTCLSLEYRCDIRTLLSNHLHVYGVNGDHSASLFGSKPKTKQDFAQNLQWILLKKYLEPVGNSWKNSHPNPLADLLGSPIPPNPERILG